jgi:hypothetical protein
VSKLEESIEKVDAKCDRIDTTLAVLAVKFEEHLKQDEKMYEEFKHMVQILRENTDSLKDHVMRTNTLQDMVIGINKRLEPLEQERLRKDAVNEFLKHKAAKWAKIATALAGLITIVYYIIKIKSGV